MIALDALESQRAKLKELAAGGDRTVIVVEMMNRCPLYFEFCHIHW